MLLHRYLETARSSTSLQAFSDYRTKETLGPGLGWEGLVEYETLELRLNPPQIEVENSIYDDLTVLTIDSANRSGTLVEVVLCLAELGLLIRRARISSDGGWFVDEFYITESPRGKVTDPRKIATLKKMLDVDAPVAQTSPKGLPEPVVSCTVFELAGSDHTGLLAAVIQLLAANGCSITFAAVWTLEMRVAMVFGARDVAGGPISDLDKLNRLQQTLANILGPGDAVVQHEVASGALHPERRLHRLLLLEEQRIWTRQQPRRQGSQSALTAMLKEASAAFTQNQDSKDSATSCYSDAQNRQSSSVDDLHCAVQNIDIGALSRSRSTPHSNPSLDAAFTRLSVPDLDFSEVPLPSLPAATNCYSGVQDGLAEVSIKHAVCLNYWLVTIKCKDRSKLIMDTVAVFMDLGYDIYHGAVDLEGDMANIFYYVRPRYGESAWDEAKADVLKYMLESAVLRRFSCGLKLRIKTWDQPSLIESLLALGRSGFSITRADVIYASGGTTYGLTVIDSEGVAPHASLVQRACEQVGGTIVADADSSTPFGILGQAGSVGQKSCFCFSFVLPTNEKQRPHASSSVNSDPVETKKDPFQRRSNR